MKLTVSRAALLAALDPVRRVVEKKGTVPILQNVDLSAHAGDHLDAPSLCLTGTNLDRELSVVIAAQIEAAGSTTVPAHLLYDIVRKLPATAEVRLETDAEGAQMTVSSGRSKFRLQCLPSSDFPEIRRDELPTTFSLTGDEVRTLFARTAFAASTEQTRYYLNGVHLHYIAGPSGFTGMDLFVGVATDGHRLAKAEIAAPKGTKGMPAIIIPSDTIDEVIKLVGKSDIEVEVRLSDRLVAFQIGNIELYSKLVDGTFPDYQRVIPAANNQLLRIDRSALAAAVDRVATVSAERGRGVKIELSPEWIRLSMSAPDAGTSTEDLDAAFDGQPFEIGTNSRYLGEILGQMDCETIEWAMAGPGAPTLLRNVDADAFTYVLMPMRV